MPNLLRQYRTRAKLSQRELARRTGISQPTIQRFEVESTAINKDFAAKFADYFSVKLETLFPVFSLTRADPKQAFARHPQAGEAQYASERVWCRFNLRGGLSRLYHLPAAYPDELELMLDGDRDSLRAQLGSDFYTLESDGLVAAIRASEIVSLVSYAKPAFTAPDHDDPVELITLYARGERDPDTYAIAPDTVDVSLPGARQGAQASAFQALWARLSRDDPKRDDAGLSVPLAGEEEARLTLVLRRLAVVEFPLLAMRPRLAEAQGDARADEAPHPFLDNGFGIDLNAFPETRRFLISQANRRRRLKDEGLPTDTAAEMREASELSQLVQAIREREPA